MIFYFSLYLIPGFFLLNFFNKNNYINVIFWRSCFLTFLFFVGFKYGLNDWYLYEILYENFLRGNLINFNDSNFLFLIILKIFSYYNINFHLVMFFFSFISLFILFYVADSYENPWLIIVLSIPLLIVMLYMGFIRQGLAVSFILLSIQSLIKKKNIKSLFLIFLASSFHISAIVFSFLLISQFSFSMILNKILYYLSIILISLILIVYFNSKYIDRSIFFYAGIGNYFQSSGFYFRFILNVLPIVIYFYFYQNLIFSDIEKRIITLLVILSLFLFPCSFLFSTLADRLNYYLVPLQFIIYSKFYIYCKNKNIENLFSIYILSLSFFTLVGWFILGTTSNAWLPYKFNVNLFKDSTFLGKDIEACSQHMSDCLPDY
jgi:hypothetical protein